MDLTKLAEYLNSFEENDPNYELALTIKTKIAQDLEEPEIVNNSENEELTDTDVTTNTSEQRSSDNQEGEMLHGAFEELEAQNQIDEEKDQIEMPGDNKAIEANPGSSAESVGYSESTMHQKVAAAFIKDVFLKELPDKVRRETSRFIPSTPDIQVIHYGMVVKDLLPKVDKANFTTAEKHVRELPKKELDKTKLLNDMKFKYIFLLNDKIVDGHHFLAKVKAAGITNSLNVLDLTPARLQRSVKKASLFALVKTKLNVYGNNNSR